MISVEQLQAAIALPDRTGSSDYDLNPDILENLPKNRVLRPASVLVALIERPMGLSVILTRRSAEMQHHPGQIAFPGGKVERDETGVQAALREAQEEIGLPAENVQILGAIDPHETVSSFCVTPFIGLLTDDFHPVPERGEVAEVFEAPLGFILNPDNFQRHSRIWQGRMRSYLTVPYGPHYIWGATARMLHKLSERLESL